MNDTVSPSTITWLGAATARLLACQTQDELIDAVDAEVRRGLGVDRVGLTLTDECQGTWAWVLNCDESGQPFRDPERQHYPLASFAASVNLARFADGRTVAYTPDLLAIATPAQYAHLDGPTRENIAAVLRREGQIVGLLSVDNLPSGRPLAPELATPLAVFAGVLAQAVETLRARRREQDARAEAEALAHQLALSTKDLREREEQYRRIVETTQEGIWQIDAEGKTTFVNSRMAEMLGYSVEELIGVSPLSLKDGVERARLEARLDLRRQGHVGQTESKYRRKDGADLWVLSSASPLFDGQGHYLGALSTMVDITARKRAEETLRQANRARAAISACTRAMIRATTEAELLQQVCETIVSVGGYRFAWVGFAVQDAERSVWPVVQAGYSDGYLDTITVSWADTPHGRGPVGTAIRTGQPAALQNMQADLAAAPWRAAALARGYASALALPLRGDGDVLGILCIYAAESDAFDDEEERLLAELADDVAYGLAALRTKAERTHAEEALAYQVLHDALTDLPNRRLLYDRLEQALTAACRAHAPLALLLLDLDRFKEVNDTFGHHHGDELLREVSARLGGLARDVDTVARLGGDEFALLLVDGDEAAAGRVAQQIQAALDTPILVEGQALHATGSIGIAIAPDHGAEVHTLLRRADVAMYAAKSAKTGYAVYAPAQDQYSPQRLAFIGDLREAIAGGTLALHYQPQVTLAPAPCDPKHGPCGRLVGVEALVRWRHPRHGEISPAEFIPVAERTGLIKPLTEWVMNEALRQCRVWKRGGLLLPVSVNLSAWSLYDPGLARTIATALQEHGVPPAWLRIEITESALMADVERAMDVLSEIVALGVRISVDDYGTGYSSLAYIKRLPVDELKIDRSFVRDLGKDETDGAIVRSTVALGHALGLRVVAEGVEDVEAWHTLAEIGCDLAQGYYVCPPLPARKLRRSLREAAWATA